MSPQEEKSRQLIHSFLKETSEIFYWVKSYSILIEQLLPDNKAPIHAANELKSLVFHLYNSVDYPEHVETNILEAKEHLCRAFYDLHSMVVSIYIKQIASKVRKFKLTTMAEVCPEYSQTIRPSMRDIQKNLREIRSSRNTDIALLQNGIKKFEEHVKALETYNDIIEEYTPDLLQYEKEEKHNRRKDKMWDVIKILITAAITATATYFITIAVTKKKAEIENSQPEIQKPNK